MTTTIITPSRGHRAAKGKTHEIRSNDVRKCTDVEWQSIDRIVPACCVPKCDSEVFCTVAFSVTIQILESRRANIRGNNRCRLQRLVGWHGCTQLRRGLCSKNQSDGCDAHTGSNFEHVRATQRDAAINHPLKQRSARWPVDAPLPYFALARPRARVDADGKRDRLDNAVGDEFPLAQVEPFVERDPGTDGQAPKVHDSRSSVVTPACRTTAELPRMAQRVHHTPRCASARHVPHQPCLKRPHPSCPLAPHTHTERISLSRTQAAPPSPPVEAPTAQATLPSPKTHK
mmetsp:Transcript_22787/g.69713  ORF Transcript_22787/g.69713 Transcript_22787/m.69713 type:complete len:287 (-) Transcript_22787:2-862(-)